MTSPISVTGYLATIAVTPTLDGSGSQIEWSATFTPIEISSQTSSFPLASWIPKLLRCSRKLVPPYLKCRRRGQVDQTGIAS